MRRRRDGKGVGHKERGPFITSSRPFNIPNERTNVTITNDRFLMCQLTPPRAHQFGSYRTPDTTIHLHPAQQQTRMALSFPVQEGLRDDDGGDDKYAPLKFARWTPRTNLRLLLPGGVESMIVVLMTGIDEQ